MTEGQKPRKKRVKSTPKGRRVDPGALKDVRALLGDAPRRRDLLIEHLHLIQDRFGCLSAAHLVALAAEMKMAMAEVYEVATFYHHFDVVKDGDAPPPAITVRVCDSIACELAGSLELLHALEGRAPSVVEGLVPSAVEGLVPSAVEGLVPSAVEGSTLGADVRVIRAPCVGRCDAAPVAVVGQNPV